ncbi:MAG: FtsX-like permease family protein, partial [Gaiellaceae bacterium]
LGPPRPLALAGRRLATRQLAVPISVSGDDLAVTASVQTPRGAFATLRLGETQGPRRTVLRAPVPPSARGGKLVALAFNLTNTGLHGVPNAGLNVNPVARGVLTLGLDLRGWRGANGLSPLGPHRFLYAVTSAAQGLARAPQPTDGRPLSVVVSKGLAAAAGARGVLPLDVEGQRVLARIVGTVSRFPSVHGDAVIADAGSLAETMNAAEPGSAVPDEIWLDARDPAQAEATLRRPPFTTLQIESRRALERRLAGDPLARGALLVLAGAAIAALALALVGLLLGLVADLRDESGELLDLEAQGATPATLRRHVRLRTFVVAAFALVGGLGAGAALVALVVRLVALTAEATAPEPPLALSLDWKVVGLAVGVYLAAAALLAVLATRTAFRGDAPGRLSEAGA